MVTWNKEGWRVDDNPFVKTYLHKERGIAIMSFWTHFRLAFLTKDEVVKFDRMMDAPNYQFMEAFILERSQMRID